MLIVRPLILAGACAALLPTTGAGMLLSTELAATGNSGSLAVPLSLSAVFAGVSGLLAVAFKAGQWERNMRAARERADEQVERIHALEAEVRVLTKTVQTMQTDLAVLRTQLDATRPDG